MKEITGNPYLTQATALDNEADRIFASRIALASTLDEALWRTASAEEKTEWAAIHERPLVENTQANGAV